jgi:hypothetical protein
MIREFLTWWGRQLADCVPEKWRRFGPPGDDALVIAPVGPVPCRGNIGSPEKQWPRASTWPVRLDTADLLRRRASRQNGAAADRSGRAGKTVTPLLAAERDLGQALA